MEACKINIERAKDGMKLSQPIYDYKNTLLVPRDVILTECIIQSLILYGIEEIWVEKNIEIFEEKIDSLELPLYIEQIRQSVEFIKFHKAHKKSVKVVKKALNELVLNNKEIEATYLIHEVDDILESVQNGMQVLDMLQCIHDYDDPTYIHSVNVALICNVMGRWFQFDHKKIETLTLCGLLHDIGKLMVPPEIIKKPGKLTNAEFSIIQTHPDIGYSIIKNKKINEKIKICALQHHEKCDGTGYPNGLKCDEIDEFAKIVTIADVYDAMTANRVYRKGICPFDVIEIFEAEGIEKYDLTYLKIFLKRIAESYINKFVQLSNEQIGKLIMINQHRLSKPLVKVDNQFLDLSRIKGLSIKKIL